MCVKFEHFLPFYSVFTIDFEQVNVSCDERFGLKVRAEWFIEEQILPATFISWIIIIIERNVTEAQFNWY